MERLVVVGRGDNAFTRAQHGGMTGRIRYLHSQKLPNQRIEAVLLGYACGIPTNSIVRVLKEQGMPTATNTVAQIVTLMRQRLCEIDYFPNPGRFRDYLDTEEGRFWPLSSTAERLDGLLRLPHVRTQQSDPSMLAEALFRAEHPFKTPEEMLYDFNLAVRITGPLNRPPINRDLWREHSAVIMHQDLIRSRRRDPRLNRPGNVEQSNSNRIMIRLHEDAIRHHRRSIRLLQDAQTCRARRERAKGSIGARPRQPPSILPTPSS